MEVDLSLCGKGALKIGTGMGPLKDLKQMWVARWDTPAPNNAVFTAPLTRSRWTLHFSPRFPEVGQSDTKEKK